MPTMTCRSRRRCPVCNRDIAVGEPMQAHQSLNSGVQHVHPECADRAMAASRKPR